MGKLSHLDEHGRARMVNIGAKADSERVAVARGEIHMSPATLDLVSGGNLPKGDVLGVARVAGIMAAKRTGDLIPLCHPLAITRAEVSFQLFREPSYIEIEATVATIGKTGVEMEALTAVSVAALTVYDMAKAAEKSMIIQNIRLIQKTGGRGGTYIRTDAD